MSNDSEIEALKEKILDHEDTLRRLESQHDVLESFCFGLEKEHEKARAALEATKAELQASYDQLRALKDEQDDILANVLQGILTINRNYEINPGHSRVTTELFGESTLAGRPFDELFESSPNTRARVRRYLELCFASLHATPQMLARLNPLHEYFHEPTGKSLSISFARIAESPGAPRIAKLMAVIDDRTAEHQLNLELQRRTQEQAAAVEKAYRLIVLPPDVVREFMGEATHAIGELADDIAIGDEQAIARCMWITHSLKGNARGLNLDTLGAAAHQLESALAAVQSGGDKAQLTEPLRALREAIEDGEQMFQRLLGVRDALKSAAASPASGLEVTLRNLANQCALSAGKRVELVFTSDLAAPLPTHLAYRAKNALVQLVRNAVAHGIEEPNDRKLLGKPEVGRITVAVTHDDRRRLVINCTDDGCGIDPQRMRDLAVERGVLRTVEASALDDAQALELVFRSGLSGSANVTELAGRGIGLDVVKGSVEVAGGTVSVTSLPGAHTRFVMTFPSGASDRGSGPQLSVRAPKKMMESGS